MTLLVGENYDFCGRRGKLVSVGTHVVEIQLGMLRVSAMRAEFEEHARLVVEEKDPDSVDFGIVDIFMGMMIAGAAFGFVSLVWMVWRML